MHRVSRALIPLFLLGSSGCAFLTLSVEPPKSDELTAPPSVARGRQLVVMPFEDIRPDKSRCGMQRNGWGIDTANVECSVAPASWISQALVEALTRAGFRVVDGQSAIDPSTVYIQGKLVQFFLEPDVGFFLFSPEADISVNLLVTSPSGLSAQRVFYFKAVEASLFGTESNFQAAVTDATAQSVNGMVAAIASLLDRYPQLGHSVASPGAISAITPGASR